MEEASMGGSLPPPLALAASARNHQAQGSDAASLDDLFAIALSRLMEDGITPDMAIQGFMEASTAAMQRYRVDASAMLHRAAHRLHIFELAAEQESQAATWLLLLALYCSGETPAGVYMGAADVGRRPTLRQMVADTVNSDTSLRRFAQVVAWLESLAAQKLAAVPSSRFAPHEAVWRATQLSLGAASSSGSRPGGRARASGAAAAAAAAPELDPDAPSRHQGPLLADMDQQAEERLGTQLWHLIRAGKVREARQLCCQAGQAWRSLSLSVGGEWGPLPLGAAAAEAARVLDGQAAANELAWEVEGGSAAGTLAWKWACLAAADAAADAGGNKWEAAVYAAQCGHIKRMLPVCNSWEDEAWAYCRSWLTLQVDALLLEGSKGGDVVVHQTTASEMLGISNTSGDLQVPADLLQGCVDLAAACGYSQKPASKQRLNEGLAVMAGGWPLPRLAAENEAYLLPSDFKQLADLLASSSKAGVAAACRQQHHALQLQVMAEDWGGVVGQLAGSSRRAKEQLDGLRRRRPRPRSRRARQQSMSLGGSGGAAYSASGMTGGDDGDVDMGTEEDSASQALGGQLVLAGDGDGDADGCGYGDDGASGSGSSGMSQAAAVDVLRFNAHLALALRALGLLTDPAAAPSEGVGVGVGAGDDNMTASLGLPAVDDLARLQHELSGVVQRYAGHLATQEAALTLVPLLMCHLPAAGRQALLVTLLCTAMGAWRDNVDRQQALYTALDQAFTQWHARQALAQQQNGTGEGALPTNGLYGDVRPEELRLLLQHAMAQVSQDSGLSASERCSYLRWLFYSYLAAAHEAAAAAAGLSDVGAAGAVVRDQQPQLVLDWQSIWLDALSSTLQLAAQLALSPGFGGQALVQLFSFIVPSGFPDAVAAAAVRAAAAALQAGPGAPRAAMADLQVQLHIQRQVQALAFWQRYAQLDGRYEAWMADAEGVAGGDAVYDANTADSLVACGEALVQEMLALAQDDSLLQPATPNIVHALACAAAVTGQQPLAIASGQALATPQHDAAAAGPMAALAAAGGDDDDAAADDDVMGSLQQPAPFNQLSLAVMLSRRQPGVVGEAQVAAHDPSQPFLPLAPHEQAALEREVAAFLRSATAATPDVTASTSLAGPGERLAGCVLVKLQSWAAPPAARQAADDDGAAAQAAARRQVRQRQAWQDMVAVAALLLTAAGSSSAGGDARPLPRLAVVHMLGSLSTQLALCRRKTTTKLLRRSAKVLQMLVRLGYTHTDLLDALLAAAADAGGAHGPQLLQQLSPTDAAKLLARLQLLLVDSAEDPVNARGVAQEA